MFLGRPFLFRFPVVKISRDRPRSVFLEFMAAGARAGEPAGWDRARRKRKLKLAFEPDGDLSHGFLPPIEFEDSQRE